MTTETPKPTAAAPKAAPAKAAPPKTIAPVYALCRINGTIEPGDIFVPATEAQRTELVDTLGAARDLNDAEQALFEKTNGAAAAADEDPIA